MIKKPQHFVLPQGIQEGTRAELDYLVGLWATMRDLDDDLCTDEVLSTARYLGYRVAELTIEFGVVEA